MSHQLHVGRDLLHLRLPVSARPEFDGQLPPELMSKEKGGPGYPLLKGGDNFDDELDQLPLFHVLKIKIGGSSKVFQTQVATLVQYPETLLAEIVSPPFPFYDGQTETHIIPEGLLTVDTFSIVLDYLRSGAWQPILSKEVYEDVCAACGAFGLPVLPRNPSTIGSELMGTGTGYPQPTGATNSIAGTGVSLDYYSPGGSNAVDLVLEHNSQMEGVTSSRGLPMGIRSQARRGSLSRPQQQQQHDPSSGVAPRQHQYSQQVTASSNYSEAAGVENASGGEGERGRGRDRTPAEIAKERVVRSMSRSVSPHRRAASSSKTGGKPTTIKPDAGHQHHTSFLVNPNAIERFDHIELEVPLEQSAQNVELREFALKGYKIIAEKKGRSATEAGLGKQEAKLYGKDYVEHDEDYNYEFNTRHGGLYSTVVTMRRKISPLENINNLVGSSGGGGGMLAGGGGEVTNAGGSTAASASSPLPPQQASHGGQYPNSQQLQQPEVGYQEEAHPHHLMNQAQALQFIQNSS